MILGKPQHVLSVIANVYFSSLAVGAVTALMIRLTSRPPHIALSFLILLVVP